MSLEDSFTAFLAAVIILVGLGVGADTTPEDFKSAWKQPQAVLCGFACQYGFMPLFAFALSKAANLPEYTAIGVILTGSAPGGATSNLFTLWSRGDVPLSITMSFCSTLAALFMMPLLVFVYIKSLSDAKVKIPWVNILLTTLLIVIPTALGLYARRSNKTQKACGYYLWEWLRASASIFGGIFVLVSLIAALFLYWDDAVAARWELWVMAMVMEPLGCLFGYVASKLCGLPPRSHRTIALECGMQNFPFAMVIVALSFDTDSDEGKEALLFPVMYGLGWCINSPWLVVVFRYLLPIVDEDGGDGNAEPPRGHTQSWLENMGSSDPQLRDGENGDKL